jgi:hypothetical protein
LETETSHLALDKVTIFVTFDSENPSAGDVVLHFLISHIYELVWVSPLRPGLVLIEFGLHELLAQRRFSAAVASLLAPFFLGALTAIAFATHAY